MSTWRLLGKIPSARSREKTNPRLPGEWNPWENAWIPSPDGAIVLRDQRGPSQSRHVPIYSVERDGDLIKFGAECALSSLWRFYVPASPGEGFAFEASPAKYEGFWRRSRDVAEALPWPEPEETWAARISFLIALDRVEAQAQSVPCRGFSFCRVCHQRNGIRSYRFAEWEWPEGFRHYIAQHQVRPSPEFERFIRSQTSPARTPGHL
jgi:hypothetical protein